LSKIKQIFLPIHVVFVQVTNQKLFTGETNIGDLACVWSLLTRQQAPYNILTKRCIYMVRNWPNIHYW